MRSNAETVRHRILSISVMRKKEPEILFAIFKLLSMACVSSSSSNLISFPPLFNEKQSEAIESTLTMNFPIIRTTFKTVLGASSRIAIGSPAKLFTTAPIE